MCHQIVSTSFPHFCFCNIEVNWTPVWSGCLMAFLPHSQITLYSSSTAGVQWVWPVLMRHADSMREKDRDSVLESCVHILAALYSGKDQTNMSFRYLLSLKLMFSHHTHTQSTPLAYQYVMVISIHSLTWRNSQYHPNYLLSPAQPQLNKVDHHDRNHKNDLYYR